MHIDLPDWLITDIDELAAIRGLDRDTFIRITLMSQVTADLKLHRDTAEALAIADRMLRSEA